MKQQYAIKIEAPAWVTPEHFKKAMPLLVQMLQEMNASRDPEEAMRGYIWAANRDGFPVKAGFATKPQLEEICVRAFWWAFERIAQGKTLTSEGGSPCPT